MIIKTFVRFRNDGNIWITKPKISSFLTMITNVPEFGLLLEQVLGYPWKWVTDFCCSIACFTMWFVGRRKYDCWRGINWRSACILCYVYNECFFWNHSYNEGIFTDYGGRRKWREWMIRLWEQVNVYLNWLPIHLFQQKEVVWIVTTVNGITQQTWR